MKIVMVLDRRSYSGSPLDIVRKLRSDAIHMKTRDADAYMRAVTARLRVEQQADVALDGDSLEERCESFLAGTIRSGMAIPEFQREHIDSASIRILRKARGLTQERLAALLGVSFTTLNRWEADTRLPSNVNTLKSIDEELFAYFSSSKAPVASPLATAPHTGRLLRARERARGTFRPQGNHLGVAAHHKRT